MLSRRAVVAKFVYTFTYEMGSDREFPIPNMVQPDMVKLDMAWQAL